MYLNDQEPACRDALKALLQHAPSYFVAADSKNIGPRANSKSSVFSAAATEAAVAASVVAVAAMTTATASVSSSSTARTTTSPCASAVEPGKSVKAKKNCLEGAPTTSTALIDLLGTLLGDGDAHLCELSALVARSGAPRQPLHPDTRFADTVLVAPNNNDVGAACPRYTTFVALQVVGVVQLSVHDNN